MGEKNKKERLENALLEYIERYTKDTQPEIAATIPTVAMALIELWSLKEKKKSVKPVENIL